MMRLPALVFAGLLAWASLASAVPTPSPMCVPPDWVGAVPQARQISVQPTRIYERSGAIVMGVIRYYQLPDDHIFSILIVDGREAAFDPNARDESVKILTRRGVAVYSVERQRWVLDLQALRSAPCEWEEAPWYRDSPPPKADRTGTFQPPLPLPQFEGRGPRLVDPERERALLGYLRDQMPHLIAWVRQATAWPIPPDAAPPSVEIEALAWGLVGYYDSDRNHIGMSAACLQGLSNRPNGYCQAALLHEIVHWAQYQSKRWPAQWSGIIEAEARDWEHRFLQELDHGRVAFDGVVLDRFDNILEQILTPQVEAERPAWESGEIFKFLTIKTKRLNACTLQPDARDDAGKPIRLYLCYGRWTEPSGEEYVVQSLFTNGGHRAVAVWKRIGADFQLLEMWYESGYLPATLIPPNPRTTGIYVRVKWCQGAGTLGQWWPQDGPPCPPFAPRNAAAATQFQAAYAVWLRDIDGGGTVYYGLGDDEEKTKTRTIFLSLLSRDDGRGWNAQVPPEWRDRAIRDLFCRMRQMSEIPPNEDWNYQATVVYLFEGGRIGVAGEVVATGRAACR